MRFVPKPDRKETENKITQVKVFNENGDIITEKILDDKGNEIKEDNIMEKVENKNTSEDKNKNKDEIALKGNKEKFIEKKRSTYF